MQRSTCGISTIELIAGLIVLIPVVLVLFDLSAIAIAVQANDSACREAARAAALGPPPEFNSRAQVILTKANQKSYGSMVSNFQMVSLSSNAFPSTIPKGFSGPITGTITVKTQVDIKPFIVQWAYAGQSPLQMRSIQTYPISYVVP